MRKAKASISLFMKLTLFYNTAIAEVSLFVCVGEQGVCLNSKLLVFVT